MVVHGSSDNGQTSLRDQLSLSNQLIDELRDADTPVLGVPVYNFGIPASLKQQVDILPGVA